MRRIFLARFSLFLALFSSVAAAADLKVNVMDRQGAAVAGAEVSLLTVSGNVVAKKTSSARGVAVLRRRAKGPFQVRVLAAGFAPLTVDVAEQPEISVVRTGRHGGSGGTTQFESLPVTPLRASTCCQLRGRTSHN